HELLDTHYHLPMPLSLQKYALNQIKTYNLNPYLKILLCDIQDECLFSLLTPLLFLNIIKAVIGLLPTNIYIIYLYQPELSIATLFNHFLLPFCISRSMESKKSAFVSVSFNLRNKRSVYS